MDFFTPTFSSSDCADLTEDEGKLPADGFMEHRGEPVSYQTHLVRIQGGSTPHRRLNTFISICRDFLDNLCYNERMKASRIPPTIRQQITGWQ